MFIQEKKFLYQDELTKYQRLLEYANDNTLLPDCNSRVLAEHYYDVQQILKRVKLRLKQDIDHVRGFIASEDSSDSICSRTSSVNSEGQLNVPPYTHKISTKLTIEEESDEATSSADETDDDLDTQLVRISTNTVYLYNLVYSN